MTTRHAISALCALLLAAPALADTVNVPGDFATIGEAVANAVDGDEIVVTKGRYEESVMVDGFNGLTIRGKGKVVIAPPAGDALVVSDSEDVLIQGIRVEGGDDGFVFDNCQVVELTRFRVDGVSSNGVFAVGSTDVTISRGKIDDCGVDGVSFADEASGRPVVGASVSSVNVSNCDEDGFDFLGENIVVERCKASNCDDDGFESDDFGAGPVRFENCRAQSVGDEGFELGCPGTVAIKCKATDTDDDGFDIEGDDCVLEKCSAKGASNAGFSIDDIDNAKLTKCKAIKCGDQGFDFDAATNAALEKCKSVKSGGDGYRLDGGTQNCVLTRCKGSKSADFDLRDESDGSNTFPGSKFKTVFED